MLSDLIKADSREASLRDRIALRRSRRRAPRAGLLQGGRRLASVGCATSLTFAGVLAWAATALAPALALTLVLTLARVFG